MMRRSTACNIFFLAIGCLLLPQYTTAQNTHGSASLIFDDATGLLHGYSATDPDYSVQGYYNSWIVGTLLDETHDGPEGYGFTYLDVQTNIGQGRVEQGTQAEAEADTQYKLESLHQVQAIYYEYLYLDPPNDPEERYIDYFNFESAGGFNYEYAHTFHGPGPSILMDAGNRVIDLGTTYDQKKTGVPHHLRVISDTRPATSCGSVRRLIKFRVVDVNGRGVGHSHTKETFEDINNPAITYSSIYNSCQNSSYSPPACSKDVDGTFTDQLWVGCPSSGGDCGFPEVRSVWTWCPPNRPAVDLSRNVYYIRHSVVFVNGIQEYAPGMQLYP